jgi:hypothetical protein
MAIVYNISDWNYKEWVQTGGTREKCFVENPADGKLYFFKESIEKYPSEFWSEIIASKVGKHFGFDLLDYNIGISHNTVGCICESMIEPFTEELLHGVSLLKDANPKFKITRAPIIIFEEVEKSFRPYPGFINKFIEILIFDSIIGNQDRHSENWAIIRSLDLTNKNFNKRKILVWFYEKYKSTGLKFKDIPFKKYYMQLMSDASLVNIKFSPIYDSGSSLGREIGEDKIELFLTNDDEIKKYIRKGKSEIKWEKEKKNINHFELLKQIKSKHNDFITKSIKTKITNYNKEELTELIMNIDVNLTDKYAKSKLSLQRKKLIIKFIHNRIAILKELINENQG